MQRQEERTRLEHIGLEGRGRRRLQHNTTQHNTTQHDTTSVPTIAWPRTHVPFARLALALCVCLLPCLTLYSAASLCILPNCMTCTTRFIAPGYITPKPGVRSEPGAHTYIHMDEDTSNMQHTDRKLQRQRHQRLQLARDERMCVCHSRPLDSCIMPPRIRNTSMMMASSVIW